MDNEDAFGRCLEYLDSQSQVRPGRVRYFGPRAVAVAIARQTGSGAIPIAHKLADFLQAQTPADERPWTVFDKNLIAKVLEDHHLPARLARFLPEDRVSAINDTLDEILGLHPPSWVIVRQSTETILKLAEMGNVILVGRGVNAITNRLPGVLRLRLVGSLERRVARVQEQEHLDRAQAQAFLRRNDLGRARYVKKYFHRDINDPLLYDLTINTDNLPEEEAVRLIADQVLRRKVIANQEVVTGSLSHQALHPDSRPRPRQADAPHP
jgi:Cytidylate kinase-like family